MQAQLILTGKFEEIMEVLNSTKNTNVTVSTGLVPLPEAVETVLDELTVQADDEAIAAKNERDGLLKALADRNIEVPKGTKTPTLVKMLNSAKLDAAKDASAPVVQPEPTAQEIEDVLSGGPTPTTQATVVEVPNMKVEDFVKVLTLAAQKRTKEVIDAGGVMPAALKTAVDSVRLSLCDGKKKDEISAKEYTAIAAKLQQYLDGKISVS